MKYFIKTFGCQMNVHESEKLAGMLESLGYIKSNDIKQSDVIVFNTCCIRDGVEQKILGNIGAIKKLKKSNPNLIVAVCGCMTQAEGRSQLVHSKFPFVDIIFGTHNLHEFKNYLKNYLQDKKQISDVWEQEKGIFEGTEIVRDNVYSNAWVNINFGCNNFCSYCIVPYVRGRERSRDMSEIISECKALVKEGYKYITLLGQNVNSYGNDIENPEVNFANLLREVAKIDGDFKIKFMTSHPKDLSLDVVKVIAENSKICKCIHLPIQSGSNEILKAMNRCYTREHYLKLIEMIRKYIPDAYISTDIIVGFPGESEKDFEDTLDIVSKVKYDGVFGFMFSKRSGTKAYNLPNQIDENTKKDRIHRLLALSKSITKEKNASLIGKKFNCLAVSTADGTCEVITDSGKSIIVDKPLESNKFYDIVVTKFASNKLYGKVAN